jgi:hypothetical protein
MATDENAHEARPDLANDTAQTGVDPDPAGTGTDASTTSHDDPFHSIAHALQDAAQSLGDGARDVIASAVGSAPGDLSRAGRTVYRVSYGLSYGVVFPIALLASWVPKENAVVHGLVDGARAARDLVDGMRHGALDSAPSEPGLESAAQPA